MVEILLNNKTIVLVISSKFTKNGFKLKKIERLIYMRNMDSSFNKEEPIKHIVEVNIYYQKYRKSEVEEKYITKIGQYKKNLYVYPAIEGYST